MAGWLTQWERGHEISWWYNIWWRLDVRSTLRERKHDLFRLKEVCRRLKGWEKVWKRNHEISKQRKIWWGMEGWQAEWIGWDDIPRSVQWFSSRGKQIIPKEREIQWQLVLRTRVWERFHDICWWKHVWWRMKTRKKNRLWCNDIPWWWELQRVMDRRATNRSGGDDFPRWWQIRRVMVR